MAFVNAYTPFDINSFDFSRLDSISQIFVNTSEKYSVDTSNGYWYEFSGEGFSYINDEPVTGLVERFQLNNLGATELKIFSIDFLPISDIFDAADTPDTQDDHQVITLMLSGDDLFWGSSGNDIFDGFAGNDRIRGYDGNDTLYGNLGNDEIYGLDGKDKLYGGPGSDSLFGGAKDGDNDKMWGGKDADTFKFVKKNGKDTIKDLQKKLDTIEIAKKLAKNVKEIKKVAENYKKGVALEFSKKDVLKIEGIKKKDLSDIDFDF